MLSPPSPAELLDRVSEAWAALQTASQLHEQQRAAERFAAAAAALLQQAGARQQQEKEEDHHKERAAMLRAARALQHPPPLAYPHCGANDAELAELADLPPTAAAIAEEEKEEEEEGDEGPARRALLQGLHSALSALCLLVPRTVTPASKPPPPPPHPGASAGPAAAPFLASERPAPEARRPVIIEVLSSSSGQDGGLLDDATAATEEDEQQQQQHEQQEALVVQALAQLALVWLPPHPHLPGLWVTPPPPADAQQLLLALARATNATPGAPAAAAAAQQQQQQEEEEAVQEFLVRQADALLPALRRVVLSGPAASAAPAAALQPEAPQAKLRERLVAARGAAALLLSLPHHAQLSRVMPVALPAALAAAHEATPVLAVHGMWALHHLATRGLAADLRWQRDLLQDAAVRLVVGCQEGAWRAACRTSTALTLALLGDQSTAAASPLSPASSSSTATPSAHQGSLARSPGLHALLGDLVHEAERHAHKQAWRLALLDERVLPALVRALGLGTLRHTARLTPLLLEWLQAHDARTRTLAARCVHALVQHTWPGAPAYAPALWHHLSALCVREAAAAAAAAEAQHNAHRRSKLAEDAREERDSAATTPPPLAPAWWADASPAARWAVGACELLAACRGEALRQAVRATEQQLKKEPPQQQGQRRREGASEQKQQDDTAARLVVGQAAAAAQENKEVGARRRVLEGLMAHVRLYAETATAVRPRCGGAGGAERAQLLDGRGGGALGAEA